jgi:hypothetical protein
MRENRSGVLFDTKCIFSARCQRYEATRHRHADRLHRASDSLYPDPSNTRFYGFGSGKRQVEAVIGGHSSAQH